MKLKITATIIFFALLIAATIIFWRHNPYNYNASLPKTAPSIIIRLEGAKLFGMKNGNRIWNISARKVDIDTTRSFVKIYGVTDSTIYHDKKPILNLNAGEIVYNDRTGGMEFTEGMILSTLKGEILSCSGAFWDPQNTVIVSKGTVDVKGHSSRLITRQVVVDLKRKQAEFQDINMQFNINKMTRSGEIAL